MNTLTLQSQKRISGGLGFISYTQDGFKVLSANTYLTDNLDSKRRRKIGVSCCSGCKVGCVYCFTNRYEKFRPLSVDEILDQVALVVKNSPVESVEETKISFKQLGDPLLNANAVLEAIRRLHQNNPDYSFVISTSAPKVNQTFFSELGQMVELGIKIRLQFSCHTTSDEERKKLCPKIPMLTFDAIADVVHNWPGELVTLNFVIMEGFSYDAETINKLFDPTQVFIKINYIDPNCQTKALALKDTSKRHKDDFRQELKKHGFICADRQNPLE